MNYKVFTSAGFNYKLANPSGFPLDFITNEVEEDMSLKPEDFVLWQPSNFAVIEHPDDIYEPQINRRSFMKQYGDERAFLAIYDYLYNPEAKPSQYIVEFCQDNDLRIHKKHLLKDLEHHIIDERVLSTDLDSVVFYICARAKDLQGLTVEEMRRCKAYLNRIQVDCMLIGRDSIRYDSPELKHFINTSYELVMQLMEPEMLKVFVSMLKAYHTEDDGWFYLRRFLHKHLCFKLASLAEDQHNIVALSAGNKIRLVTLEEEFEELYPSYVLDRGKLFLRVKDVIEIKEDKDA